MLPKALPFSVPNLAINLPQAWRSPLAWLAGIWAVLIALFFADWRDMAWQWWDSSTYNHILVVPPILAWMVWQRSPQLADINPKGWWPGAVLFGGSMLLWVLGAFSGLGIAQQTAVVAMLVASALALLGPKAGAALTFPLFYMFFLVPFGDELVPLLQMITAALTIGLVQLSGIPAVVDGVFIDTPAGLFEVAEACSGVKFLIAMIAFGALVSNACFVSWRRRIIFMLFCIIVPVLANGVRAFATVLAAQYFGAKVATGFDHIVYGWFFFAIVIAIIMACAWRFFDRDIDDPFVSAETINASPLLSRLERAGLSTVANAALLGAVVLGGTAWAKAADALEASLPKQMFLPEVKGWKRVDYAPNVWWEPRATGAAHRLLGSYADTAGRKVDVFVAAYAAQGHGREAGGFGEGALPVDGAWSWLSPGPKQADAKSDRLLAHGHTARLVQTTYRSGALLSGSNAHLKLANMQDRLLLRERATVLLILSAEEGPKADAAQVVADFRTAAGPLDVWIDRMTTIR